MDAFGVGVQGEEAVGLSPREVELLGFERQWFRTPGAKDQAIRETFGLSSIGYYQILNTLIDRPEAVRHDPMLINRLRRARDVRGHHRRLRVESRSETP